jgi:hypothetical protein
MGLDCLLERIWGAVYSQRASDGKSTAHPAPTGNHPGPNPRCSVSQYIGQAAHQLMAENSTCRWPEPFEFWMAL